MNCLNSASSCEPKPRDCWSEAAKRCREQSGKICSNIIPKCQPEKIPSYLGVDPARLDLRDCRTEAHLHRPPSSELDNEMATLPCC